MADGIYVTLDEALSWVGCCLSRIHMGNFTKRKSLINYSKDTTAQKGKLVLYSPSLSWCEAGPGWNPRLSKAPHHTLLLKTV